jgi:hypothetical protein
VIPKRLSRLALLAPLLCALAVLVSGSGCQTSCSNAETGGPEEFHGGSTDATGSVYESAPWNGNYLLFRPQKRYQLFHGLRGTPSVVQAWLGFSSAPLGGAGRGNISEGAGNEAIVEAVNDQFVVLRNDTCETFYLRVVASNPVESLPDAGGAAGAGGVGN